MCPNICIFNIDITVFPIIIVIDIYLCLFVLIKSKKYDYYYLTSFKYIFFFPTAGALIGGKGLYALTRIISHEYTISSLFNGFVFYGGLIGSMIGMCIFCTIRNDLYIFDVFDAYLSIMPLGQSIGRIGCYLNGCCYGVEYSGIFSAKYIVEGNYVRVFPTWFCESAFCIILFLSMFIISKRKFSGFYSSVYLISYSVFRFFIEYFRGDSIRGRMFFFSTSQLLSIVILSIGIILLMNLKGRNIKNKIVIGRD